MTFLRPEWTTLDEGVEDLSKRIAHHTRLARESEGFELAQAAERAGISQRTWQRIERGENVSLSSIVAVVKALGVEPHVLLKPIPASKRDGYSRRPPSS